jgi:hypothetical protein
MRKLKGDPTDITLLLVMLFFLAISFVVAIYTNTILQSVISTTVLNESAAFTSIDSAFENVNVYGVQRGFVIFFGFLVIGILVSSFLIRVHPVFIFIYIITLGMAIFTSIYLANTYQMVAENAAFAAITANFASITFVMQHIGKILLGVGALSMVIIFGKIGGGGNSQVDL